MFPGGHEQVALAREGHGPDVFLVRIEEDARFAVGRDFVNLPVRVGGGVDLIFGVQHDGVDFQALQLGESAALAGVLPDEASMWKTLAVPLPEPPPAVYRLPFESDAMSRDREWTNRRLRETQARERCGRRYGARDA